MKKSKKVWTAGEFKKLAKAALGDSLIENEPPKKVWTWGEFKRYSKAILGDSLIENEPPKDKSGYEPSGTLEVRFFPHIEGKDE